MATVLIRCTLHPGLSHGDFEDWIRVRREEVPRVRRLRATRLGDRTWILEAEVADPPPPALDELVADLRLLGLRPAVYTAGAAPRTALTTSRGAR